MSEMLLEPVELADDELDSVSAGLLLAKHNLISVQIDKVVNDSPVTINVDITRNIVRVL